MPPLKPFPRRWWYHPPWQVTDPWRPRAFRSEDEYCNPTCLIGLPFLGHIVVRTAHTIRTRGGCDDCVTKFGPWCDGCETCHPGPRCHRWIDCDHSGSIGVCPACHGGYCYDCEPDASSSCPVT